jgi:glycerol-3-phosphate dehydrogenase
MIKQPELARRIDPPLPVTTAEVQQVVRNEMALTLEDVIVRRTELGATGLPSRIALQTCADILSRELQWSPERRQQEIDCVSQIYPFKRTKGLTA